MTTDREDEDARRTVKRMVGDYESDYSEGRPRLKRRPISKAGGLPGTRLLVVVAISVIFVGGLFGLALLVSTNGQSADSLQGKVISIADGDTLTLLDSSNRQIKVRLAEIDTPEKGQPYANKARQALSGMVFQKQVSVVIQDTDRYGRTVGRVYVGDLDVNAELVRAGAAWAYRKYMRDESLLDLEAEARNAGRGIWGLSETQQTPPWEWRRTGGTEGAPEGCLIKGNINSKGDRIYHVPGSRSYGPTKITEAKGERWFCSEQEAQAAGWRAPYR